jgi:hypothetical protein
MKKRYTLKELEALPTLSQGQTDDLKVESPTQRVWLSRMTIEDGEPYNNKVTVEKLKGGYIEAKRTDYRTGGKHGHWEGPKWESVEFYEAK